jgi:hypothetical protein
LERQQPSEHKVKANNFGLNLRLGPVLPFQSISGVFFKCFPMLFQHWKAKRDTAYGEKPEAVKTHLRNMVIVFLGVVQPMSIRLWRLTWDEL